MRATICGFGSAVFAAAGFVMITASLFSLSADVLADEPLNNNQNVCEYPSPCDLQSVGDDCSVGTCEAYAVDCQKCCACLYNSASNSYYCQNDNPGDPSCGGGG